MSARTFGYVVSETACGTPNGPKRGAFAQLVTVLQKRSFMRQPHTRKMVIPQSVRGNTL